MQSSSAATKRIRLILSSRFLTIICWISRIEPESYLDEGAVQDSVPEDERSSGRH